MHKTGKVLNYLPKAAQPKAKAMPPEIWMAETRADAERAFDRFLARYTAKYPKAAECLAKDRNSLLAFYDFPAEHWQRLRTTNPIESSFATIRHRTDRTKGCASRDAARARVQARDECGETLASAARLPVSRQRRARREIRR